MTNPAPLAGLRVLDFGHYIAGPLAAVFLADQGADVVRIVRPGARVWDSVTEETLARGKRTLELDLKDDSDRDHALALAAGCDVLIENFRPAVMDRLGLGAKMVTYANPGAVYVSLPGYSRHDERAALRAWDTTISAACGLFTDLSVAGAAVNLPPTYTPLPLPSVYAGLWGAIAAVAGIYGRGKSGRGDIVEVPLMDAAMSASAGVIFRVADQPTRYNAPSVPHKVLDAISLRSAPPLVARFVHDHASALMPPFFRNYRCRDGEVLFICAIDNANQIDKLLGATGMRRAAAELGLVQGSVFDIPPTKTNLNAYRGSSRRLARFRRNLEEVFASEDADVWAERLAMAGVPAVRQRTTAEWADLAVTTTSGVLIEDKGSSGDVVRRPAPQVDVRGRGIRNAVSPDPARRGVDWLEERGFIAPVPDANAAMIAPLAGVRVTDLANVIAGPAAGRTLAELGAEVIHVSAVQPSMGPRMTMALGLEVNQGKRSIALDLHSEGGRRVLHRMIPETDVVLYNKLPLQAKRLGAAPDQVHALNDRTVVAAVTAYGGFLPGGWEGRPAYDPVVQALTGIMRRFGGDREPAVHGIASCIDYFTGFAASFGAIVGLLARDQGATHVVARTSLVRTAGWVQLPLVGRAEEPPVSGLVGKGTHPLDHIYRARDGWVALVAPPHERSAIRVAAGGTGPPDFAKSGPWLDREIRRRSSADAVSWAINIGCSAQEVRSARSLRHEAVDQGPSLDPAAPSGRVERASHPAGERYWIPEPQWLRWTATPRERLGPAPTPGQHTREILAALAYDPEVVGRLFEDGVVADRWFESSRYLPE